MTMEIKDTFTVKSKRKEHPNAGKYPGRPSFEFGNAVRQFLGDIGPQNCDKFVEGNFVFEEEVTAEFFDSILPGDVVGLGILKGFNELGENEKETFAAYKFKILGVDGERDVMQARNVTFEHPSRKEYTGTETELTFEDISCAFGMGFGEILERDGKPYGVSEEIEYKIKIIGAKEEENETADATGTNSLPSLPETTTGTSNPTSTTEASDTTDATQGNSNPV